MVQWNKDAGDLQACMVPVLCIWREASGEGSAGMLAVAMVIRNRMLQHHETAEQTCLMKWQFSSMNAPNDPGMTRYPTSNDVSFKAAFDAWVESATITPEDDPTKGAQYYYATYISPPGWASSYTLTATIGTQKFYRP